MSSHFVYVCSAVTNQTAGKPDFCQLVAGALHRHLCTNVLLCSGEQLICFFQDIIYSALVILYIQ